MTTATKAKACGCHMDPVADDAAQESDLCSEATGTEDGSGWVIVYCPTHASAPELLEALKSWECMVMLVARVGQPWRGDIEACLAKGKAAIAKAEGRS